MCLYIITKSYYAMLIEFHANGIWERNTQAYSGLSFLKPQSHDNHYVECNLHTTGKLPYFLTFYNTK